jgi:hypothetical protein
MENVWEHEKDSIDRRDIFADWEDFEPDHPDAANPFVDFLCRSAEKVSSADINHEDCMLIPAFNLPRWPVFKAWFDELAGNDWLAEQAIVEGTSSSTRSRRNCSVRRSAASAWPGRADSG